MTSGRGGFKKKTIDRPYRTLGGGSKERWPATHAYATIERKGLGWGGIKINNKDTKKANQRSSKTTRKAKACGKKFFLALGFSFFVARLKFTPFGFKTYQHYLLKARL